MGVAKPTNSSSLLRMNISNFRSGTWVEQFEYRSFFPTPVNDDWQWDDPQIDTLLAEANYRVGELNGLSAALPDLKLFRPMFVLKEALASSRIEGNGTILDEAILDDRDAIDSYRRNEWEDVRNHITAIDRVFFELDDLPLSNRLLCHAHETLLAGASGDQKTPGEFRRSQNWIGSGSLSDALFVPPHQGDLGILTTDLEAFWHDESIQAPELIRLAISHYQFVVIHPFLDGNGRVGRIFIALFLAQKGLLKEPLLNVSSYFDLFRDDYYDALTRVAGMSELDHWVRYFLRAVEKTAKHATQTLKAAHALREATHVAVEPFSDQSADPVRVIDYLFRKPIVTVEELSDQLELERDTVGGIVDELLAKEILFETAITDKSGFLVFKAYVALFQK